jgi:hypothetical protein
MLLTLQDDSVLRIYGSAEEAVQDVEALDAEDVFRMVFDESGRRYAIRWIRPNERGLFMVGNGEYALVPDGAVDVGALLALIREAEFVEPESLKPWLGDLASRLTNRFSGPATPAAERPSYPPMRWS